MLKIKEAIRAIFPNRNIVLCILTAPIIVYGTYKFLEHYSERDRSYNLISDINEIQWRSSKIREGFITLKSYLALAEVTSLSSYDDSILMQSAFLSTDINRLLSQSFLSNLIRESDIIFLRSQEVFFDTTFPYAMSADTRNYHALLDSVEVFMPRVWQITTLASTASYVKARTAQQARDATLLNYAYASFFTITIVVIWWLFIFNRTNSQYNHQVRQFALLFSHMTVTRIAGLSLWANEGLSPDSLPNPRMLKKARERLDYLTTMVEWLSRIAIPHEDIRNATLRPLDYIFRNPAIVSGTPIPQWNADTNATLVLAPEAHYHLILQELIKNAQDAVKHTYKPQIIVSASVKRRWYLFSKQLTIAVEDNGPGMSKEQRAKAISPFYSTKGETQGHSGLGLYGCIEMVRSMKGKFAVTSSVGHGTRMTFTCPVLSNMKKDT